jgi:hypothetical protein
MKEKWRYHGETDTTDETEKDKEESTTNAYTINGSERFESIVDDGDQKLREKLLDS